MSKLKQKILKERSKHALALSRPASILASPSSLTGTSMRPASDATLFTGLSTHRKAALNQWMDCLFSHSFTNHTSFPYSPLLPRPYITHWTDEWTDSLVYQLLRLATAVSRTPTHGTREKDLVFGFKECLKMIKRAQHEAASMVLIVAMDLEWIVYRDLIVQALLAEARRANISVVFALSTMVLGTLVAASGRKAALVGSVCFQASTAACRAELKFLLDDVRVCQSEFRMKFLSYSQIDPTLPSPLWICCWYGLEEGDNNSTTNLLSMLLSRSHFRSQHLSAIDGKLGLDPVLICATHGHTSQMKMLVEQKYACLDRLASRSFKGQTAVSLLCEHGHAECLQYLLQKRVAESEDFQKWMTMPSYHGWSPLRYAISNGQLAVLNILEPYGCVTHALDAENETPLFWLMRSESNMTQYRFIEIMKRLIQCCINSSSHHGWMQHENRHGQTVFHLLFSVVKNETMAMKALKVIGLECGQSLAVVLAEIKHRPNAPYEIAKEKQWMTVLDLMDHWAHHQHEHEHVEKDQQVY